MAEKMTDAAEIVGGRNSWNWVFLMAHLDDSYNLTNHQVDKDSLQMIGKWWEFSEIGVIK